MCQTVFFAVVADLYASSQAREVHIKRRKAREKVARSARCPSAALMFILVKYADTLTGGGEGVIQSEGCISMM